MGRYLLILLVGSVIMTAQRSFVDPAALPDHGGTHSDSSEHTQDLAKDAEVRELENLKHPPNGEAEKSVKIVKSQSSSITEVNGKHDERHDLREYIDEDGKLVARVHQHKESSNEAGEKPHDIVSTEIEVPSEGVHRTIVQDSNNEGQKEVEKTFPGAARLTPCSSATCTANKINLQTSGFIPSMEMTENGNRRTFNADITQEENNNVDHYSAYSGVQYSPLDMAEYIFWTGDEKGVTLAIEEFLQEGLMTREEAIAFLQEIKYNIEYLETHYAQQRLKSFTEDKQMQESKENYEANIQRFNPIRKFNHENILKQIMSNVYERNNNLPVGMNLPQVPSNYFDSRQDIYKKNVQDNLIQDTYKMSSDQYEKESPVISEDEYNELIERLKIADLLYTEYSLEEIIYQLAKVMFTQSLSRGSTEAQVALQKFTNFLELEADQGRISRTLEKKVLDVLIESLTDTLTEHPELVNVARVGLGGNASTPPTNKILRQLLEMGLPEHMKSNSEATGNYRENPKAHNSQNKYHYVPGWMKPKDQINNEHQMFLPVQTLKRFKMSV